MISIQQPNSNHYGNTTNAAADESQYQTQTTSNNYNQEPVDNKAKYKQKFFNYFKKFLPLMVTRGIQFASSAICLGTTSYARHEYGSGHHTKKQNFAVAVSAISVFYLIALYAILMFARQFIMPGAFFLCEVVLCLLWLCAFIVLAKQHGQYSCSKKRASSYGNNYYANSDDLYYNEYTKSYTNKTYSRPCKSSKASIAFAALCFALFALTSVLFYEFVMKPNMKNYVSWKDIFKRADQIHVPGNPNGVQLHKASGLALTNPEGFDYNGPDYANEPAYRGDLEAGNGHGEDCEHNYNTYSTQDTGIKTAGDESYAEKQYQMNQANNGGTVPVAHETGYDGQKETVGAYNSGNYQSGTTNTAGGSDNYQSEVNNGHQGTVNNIQQNGNTSNTQAEYQNAPTEKEASKTENNPNEEQPSLIQQAVDVGKKYMTGAST